MKSCRFGAPPSPQVGVVNPGRPGRGLSIPRRLAREKQKAGTRIPADHQKGLNVRTLTPNDKTVNNKILERLPPGRIRLIDVRSVVVPWLRDLSFTDGAQWLEVKCAECGLLAIGEQDENKAAEEIQREHSDKFRGHRVTVELFFRECVSTRINDTPKEADQAAIDPQFDRN